MALIEFTDRGLYCPLADVYIDPWRPVARALITHGHADHARPGHGSYLCTGAAAPILKHRLGAIDVQTLGYGETLHMGGVDISFHPAGHVIGSAQIRLARGGEVWVISGDYKTENDGLSEPFEPVRCTHFVSECTFGLPVFKWQPQAQVAQDLNAWWAQNAAHGVTSILGAYSLGKAQRLLTMLDPDVGPILTHGAVAATNTVLRNQGVDLPDTVQVTAELDRKAYPGALVIAPPAALDSAWAKRFGTRSTAFASGWMRMRGVRRRRAADRGFIMSDHADWPGLLQAIAETGAENIYVTHGYTDIFARYLQDQGYNAEIIPTEFGTGEDADSPAQADQPA